MPKTDRVKEPQFNFINVLPLFPGREAYTVSEILRLHDETGIRRFALSLSFHPEGDDPYEKIPFLCESASKIFEAFRGSTALELGVLLQSTLGHGWSGNVPLTTKNWQHTVLPDGTATSRMCPLDPRFRTYVLAAVTAVARLGAGFLFVDDDFGLRGHECFCPRHVALFNKVAGKHYSRARIARMLNSGDNEQPDGKLFCEQRAKTAVSFARELRRAVDKVDSSIRCIYCSPWQGAGFVRDVARALSTPAAPPCVRINNAIYGGKDPLTFFSLLRMTAFVRKICGDMDFMDEADTFPQNYYSESAAVFHAHLTEAVLNRLDGAKLWMADFQEPTGPATQQRYESQIVRHRLFYDKLLETVRETRWTGVTTPLRMTRFPLHPEPALAFLGRDSSFEWIPSILAPFAFPVTYDEPVKGSVSALDRNAVESLSDPEISALFRGPILLDSLAAKLLSERGFDSLMGVRATDGPKNFFFSTERHCLTGRVQSFLHEPVAAHLHPVSPKTHIVTELIREAVRSDEFSPPVAPGMTFFRNSLGGRVVVCSWSPAMPAHKTLRPPRRAWLLDALDFLVDGTFDLTLEVPHPVLVRHGFLASGGELLCTLSLGLDTENQHLFRSAAPVSGVERLSDSGKWTPVRFSCRAGFLRIHTPLRCCEPHVFRLTRPS